MKTDSKVLVHLVIVIFLVVLTTAQKSYKNQRKRSSKRSQQNDEAIEQGRTLGLIRPLLGLGLSNIIRPLASYDVPFASAAANRPSSGTSTSHSDPYYGYGNYGGYSPYYYNSNNYGGYPLYRPVFPFYNVYRPHFVPGYYGGYAPNNIFGGQRPIYTNMISRPIAQRPPAGQQPLAGQKPATYPAVAPASPAASGTTTPGANSAQAAQIANLLGQLLGQQLRPLLNQGAASAAHDVAGIATSSYQDKSFRNRYYSG